MFGRSKQAETWRDRKSGRSRRRFFVFSFGFLGLGAILISFFYIVLYSSFFRLNKIEVSGTKLIPKEYLIFHLSTRILSRYPQLGIFGPQNLLFWQFGRNSEISSVTLPTLAAVEKHVDFFKKTLFLKVREREIFGFWCLENNGCFVFDENGIPFHEAPFVSGSLFLRVDDITGVPIVLGRPPLPHSWFVNMVGTLDILKSNGFAAVAKISDLGLREWTAITPAGLSFYFSFNFIPDNLKGILVILKERLALSKLTYLDFRIPNRIYYR